uniref:CKLF like MARVEL transmembrane domain containing 7 n=1 Tax=Oryctolagus cuniculus TaxID=9986 RepID=U3KN04_RABIT
RDRLRGSALSLSCTPASHPKETVPRNRPHGTRLAAVATWIVKALVPHGIALFRLPAGVCRSNPNRSRLSIPAGRGHSAGFPSLVPGVPVRSEPGADVRVFVSQVTLLIAFLCVWSSPGTHYSAYSFFEVVTICDLIMILAFYLVHLFRFYRVLTCISWPLSELLHYVIGTLLLLIASIVAASQKNNQGRLVAGAVFGFMATFLCMASVWLSYKISCVTSSTDAAV